MQLARWVEIAREAGIDLPVRVGVVTVHGMRTTGKWQKDITPALFDAEIRPVHVDFGYRMIPKVNDVVDQILDAHQQHQSRGVKRISGIGHSLGSLAIGRALERHPSLQFHRLILWGCILPCDFRWSHVRKHQQLETVLHERCCRDPWPRVAKYAFRHLEAGDSGRRGFSEPAGLVWDMHYEKTGHSNLGTAMHCEKVWVPFLVEGKSPPGMSLSSSI